MKFYISLQSHAYESGIFQKRLTLDLLTVFIVTETGAMYQAVNKDISKKTGQPSELWTSLTDIPTYCYKPVRQIATEIQEFIEYHKNGSIEFYGFKCALDFMGLHHLLKYKASWLDYYPPIMNDLYQDAYQFLKDNQEYVGSSISFTAMPPELNHQTSIGVLQGHTACPLLHNEMNVREVALWLPRFDKFLQEIKNEMILSTIPQIEE